MATPSAPDPAEAFVERAACDAEAARSSRAIVLARCERLQEQVALLLQREIAETSRVWLPDRRVLLRRIELEVLDVDRRPSSEEGCTQDHVAELAHVPRPAVEEQALLRLGR